MASRHRFGIPSSLSAFALVMASAVSPSAQASCWGQGERTTEVLRQEFRLKGSSGPIKGIASYQIYAKGEVCESGSISPVDRRKCHAIPYQRKFLRTLVIIPADGRAIELGRTEKLMPMAPTLDRNGPCTDHAGPLTNDFYAHQIGNASAWKAEIDMDIVEVRRTLQLIAEIDSTSIALQR